METIRSIGLDAGPGVVLNIETAAASDRFILKDVDGLGPPEFDVAISKGVYQGRTPLTREIEFKIALNPNYALGQRPADLRADLYGLITPYADYDYIWVNLNGSSNTVYRVKAWVKRAVPVPMSKDPELQITLACLDPYFRAPVVFSTPTTKNSWTYTNQGSAATGILMNIEMLSNISGFKFTNAWGDRQMSITYDFQTGDLIEIDTNPENRHIYVRRAGNYIDISGRLTAASEWMMLGYKENAFVGFSTSSWKFGTPGGIGHEPKHWGF